MFFLLRVAFWLGLVFVLLPTGKSADDDKPAGEKLVSEKAISIDAMQAATAAAAAMSDMSQFCTRQPAACEAGGKAAIAIGERAQSGARKVYQFITDKTDKKHGTKKSPDHTGSIADMAAGSHSTLSDDDLALEWQPPLPDSADPSSHD